MGDLMFLLGAGASRDASLPLMDDLSKGFPTWMEGQPFPAATERKQLLKLFTAAIDLVRGERSVPNIELVLSFLAAAMSFKREPHAQSIKAWNPPFDAALETVTELTRQIRNYIRDSLHSFDPASGDYLSGLLDFRADAGPIDVFTLNYDRLVQAMGARFAVRYTTGFGDTWDPGLFGGEGWDMRIFKLHGSVDWNRLPSRGVIYQGAREHYAFPKEEPTDLLLYPAEGKVTMAEPFSTLMSFFTGALKAAKTCIAIGYSFRDKDIRRIVLDALATNRSLQLLIVDPAAHDILYMRREEPDEPIFSDHPDRVSGLWATAKRALEDRMIRHRLSEIQAADTALYEVVGYRSQRGFQGAAESLLNAVERCRRTHLPGKPLSLLRDLKAGGEFQESLRTVAGGTLGSLLQQHSVPYEPLTKRFGSRGLSGYYGNVGERFGQLVMMWLLAEALAFDEQRALARAGIQEILRREAEGLLFVDDAQYWGWSYKPVDGKNDAQVLRERLERVTQYTSELSERPPATLLDLVVPEVQQLYRHLQEGVEVLAEQYPSYGEGQFSRVSVGRILVLRPHIPDWIQVMRGVTSRFEKTRSAWQLTPEERGDAQQAIPK